MRLLFKPLALALALASCAPVPTDPGPAPAEYKVTLRAWVAANFFDPHSLRDVSVSKPFPGTMYRQPGWVVCLRLNAKNRMGGYIGLNDSAYLFRDGGIVASDDHPAICAAIPHQPWPELESRGSTPK